MYRDSYSSQRFSFGFFTGPVPPVLRWILWVNVGVYLTVFVIDTFAWPDFAGLVLDGLGLRAASAVEGFQVWQFVTYAYLHDPNSPFHILLNLLFIWMFGAELAGYFGARRFLLLYHVAAFTGGVLQVVASYVQNAPDVRVIGASGALYGILAVYALLFPNRVILFFFVIPMKMKYFILILVGIDFVSGTRFLSPGTAYFAHLGGALGGFLYLRFHGRVGVVFQRLEARLQAREAEREASVRKAVDELLEKIRREGMHTLSAKEKRFLNNASKLYKKDDHYP